MKEKEDSRSGKGAKDAKTKNESKGGKTSTQKTEPKKKPGTGKTSKK